MIVYGCVPTRAARWLVTLGLAAWVLLPTPGLADTTQPRALSDDPTIDRWMYPATADTPAPGASVFQATWPVAGRISAAFGEVSRTSPRGHSGIDIAADYGDSVGAAAAGQVVDAGWSSLGYGNLVVLDHGGSVETWYGHLNVILVKVGQRVRAGELIGRVGSTGFSTGPHLHFEVRQDGQIRNPMLYLP